MHAEIGVNAYQPTISSTPTYSNAGLTTHANCFQPFARPCIVAAPTTAGLYGQQQRVDNLMPIVSTQRARNQNAFLGTHKLIDLPTFNGTPEAWPVFCVAFRETTSSYCYTDLENLLRLQKALKGDARELVESLLIHPSSVGQIMETLEFHYGRPELLVRSQIAKARAFPVFTANKMNELVHMSTMVSNMCAFLQNAGAVPHLQNPTLLDELVSKMPPNKREDWYRHAYAIREPYPTIKQFSIWLADQARFIAMSTEAAQPSAIGRVDQSVQRHKPTKSIFAVTSSNLKCSMCDNGHELYQCRQFKGATCDEKWALVKDKRLCFSCLQPNHTLQSCKKKRLCGINSCRRPHNRLLHKHETGAIVGGKSPESALVVNTCQMKVSETKTLLKFLPVRLYGPKGEIDIIAFIDEGAEVSLLEADVAKAIGLSGPANELALKWIGNQTLRERSCKVNFEISAASSGDARFHLKNVRTTKTLFLPAQTLQFQNFVQSCDALRKIPVLDYLNAVPQLLLGLPHTNITRAVQVLNFHENWAAHETKLGWTVFGSNDQSRSTSLVGHVCCDDVIAELKEQIKDYFVAESFETKDLPLIETKDTQRAKAILKDTTRKLEGQYETGLLWKSDEVYFPNNYQMALKRLQFVEAKMFRDEVFMKWYTDKIDEYVVKAYARKLTPEEAAKTSARTWYLPHFAVYNVNKGNKPRIVFDAAARYKDVSLNSWLMKGPEKYQPTLLIALLLNFRQGSYAVAGDIREMFHRINIREEDLDSQRFLWRKGDVTKPPDEYVMKAMIFGSACSPCSAQYVKNTHAEQYRVENPRAVSAIVNYHYVDDFVDSFQTESEAIEVTKAVIRIHLEAGFELRDVISNSTKLIDDVGAEYTSLVKTKSLGQEAENEKILGMFWHSGRDELLFKLNFNKVPKEVLDGGRYPTKAEVLSLTMSIFDPIGFLTNVMLVPKILMQRLWQRSTGWRDPIPEDVYREWFAWYTALEQIKKFSVPRCYHPHFMDNGTEVQLHVFVDASELAFAAVAYWRMVHDNDVRVAFVAGKSRCNPIKVISIPRLELQAAVLGVRLKNSIVENHRIQPPKIIFWSDSKTVLHWISSDARAYKQFLAHRVS